MMSDDEPRPMPNDPSGMRDQEEAYRRLMKQHLEARKYISSDFLDEVQKSIQSQVRDQRRTVVGERLISKMIAFFEQQLSRARRIAEREIRSILVQIADRYLAAGATAMVVDNGRLMTAVSHFGLPVGRTIDFDDTCLTAATDEADGLSSSMVRLEIDGVDSNRSKAFLLRTPIHQKPLGVILLEWRHDDEMKQGYEPDCCGIDLQRLAVPLLSRQRTFAASSHPTPWTPFTAGWSFRHFLSEACQIIVETLEAEYFGSHFSAAIWTYDWDDQQLWVRATHGFDEEYSTFSDHETIVKQHQQQYGVVRQTASSPRGAVVHRDDPLNSGFARPDKIHRYNLTKIVGLPLYRSLDKDGKASAVLMIYHFGDATKNPIPFPIDMRLKELSLVLQKWIESYHELRHEAAVGYARWKMEECRIPARSYTTKASEDAPAIVALTTGHHPRTIVWKAFMDVVCTCLKPDGCSVFMSTPPTDPTEGLEMMATTGIRRLNWDRLATKLVQSSNEYQGGHLQSCDKSLMLYLWRNSYLAPFRVQSVLEWQTNIAKAWEKVKPRKDEGPAAIRKAWMDAVAADHSHLDERLPLDHDDTPPSLRDDSIEKMSPRTRDHRLLAAVIEHPDARRPRAIVRLVRTTGSRPFSQDDAHVLVQLCKFFVKQGYDYKKLIEDDAEMELAARAAAE